MRHFTVLILSILSVHLSHSQIHEIGVYLGGSNFIGDVGATNYISPNQLAFGGVYKWNRSPRHSYRFSLIFTDLKAEDIDSDDPRRIQRGYEFTNPVIELSAGMEFTFFDYDLHTGKKIATPYLYSGISAAHHDNFYFANGVKVDGGGSSWALGIPMALGFKTTFIGHLNLSAEIGARFTFTDEIDGSTPKDPDLKHLRFGNINNYDWYVFSGLTLTYTFGINPCYCPN
ncbi:DUF6089 family protein [Snuella lapsa]|uniref:DUF6089 family protein n=1 Tax=Snuella lapsa TaxID=870481 RepID=A0ABP6WV67_9FLAO